MTQQPQWKCIAQLGDTSPVDYGGYFVFVDETGVYPPEAELLQAPDDDDAPEGWTVYRFILEPCTYDPVTGVLSDNPFHPQHSAWFAQSPAEQSARPQDTTNLANVARTMGTSEAELRTLLCSTDPVDRAHAWRMIGDYHGFENLDSYPLTFHDRAEVDARYAGIEVRR